MIKAELLAPAGNQDKLYTALNFGADAAYIGGKNFSLRAFADNFTFEEICRAVEFAHGLGKKIYVTLNVFAKNTDFALLSEELQRLEKAGVDAVIVSDPGIVYLAKKVAPRLALHLSTQANTTNRYSARFWKEQGVERIVLARELSLAEISEIHEFEPTLELEAFVHGAMCISYSGRCLLSDYLDGRQSNRGACVQACRWKYEVRPIKPTGEAGEWQAVEQDEKGTYLFNSKDLNMLARLKDLENAGVSSFKIEGRMKSGYYLATVINAYRRVMDGAPQEEFAKELCAIAHRDYTEAYAFGKNAETVNYTNNQTQGDYAYIADVIGYENGYAELEMRNRFFEGDELEILSPTDTFGKTFRVSEILLKNGERTTDAKLVQAHYFVPCPYPLQKGDYIRRKNQDK